MEENIEGIKHGVVFYRASDVRIDDSGDGSMNIEVNGEPLGELSVREEENVDLVSEVEKSFCQPFDCSWYPSESEYYTIRRLLYMRKNFVRAVYRMHYVNHHKSFPCLTLWNLRNDPKGIHDLGGIHYVLSLRRRYTSSHGTKKCRRG